MEKTMKRFRTYEVGKYLRLGQAIPFIGFSLMYSHDSYDEDNHFITVHILFWFMEISWMPLNPYQVAKFKMKAQRVLYWFLAACFMVILFGITMSISFNDLGTFFLWAFLSFLYGMSMPSVLDWLSDIF